ncbi:MAG: hypothetical protein SFX72_12655 [Isosphaeraceae bacterium]|nr:hypothetical protein [Isosphaeraceae bacterium]
MSSSKKSPLHNSGFELNSASGRTARTAKSVRSGRRSTLLGILNSAYANSSRGGRSNGGESRSGSDRS